MVGNYFRPGDASKGSPGFYWILFLAFVFLFSSPYPAFSEDESADEENVCISCHLDMEATNKEENIPLDEQVPRNVIDDWKLSVHAEAGVTCENCHGGNPNDMGEAMEESAGFKGKPERKDIGKLCAGCHSDNVKMRQYSLPPGQFEDYRDSVHGKPLLSGKNENAATCTDCHGKHNIPRVADPESPAHKKNIINTCSDCHSDSDKMKSTSLPTNQFDLYKGSVHGTLFYEGDEGVPTCVTCHGNHAIEKPQQLSIRLRCANCHIDQDEMYRESRHWDSAQEKGKPVCIDCHSNHGIEKPTADKFHLAGKYNCKSCHEKDQNILDIASSIFKLLNRAQLGFDNAAAALDRVHKWSGSGFETSHLSKKLKTIEKTFKEMSTASHSLDLEKLATSEEKIKYLSDEILQEVEYMSSELNRRKIGLLVSWIVFITFTMALYKRSKHCVREED